jgi:hypothetical protein
MDTNQELKSTYGVFPEKQGYRGEISFEAEKIIQLSLKFHKEFDRRWKEEKRHSASYHNENHIQATIDAATLLINKAFNRVDPLDLRGDLQNWNQANPNAQITESEFLEAVCLAFSMHDLGNIACGLKVDEKGVLQPDYLDGYRAEGAEARSIQIAKEIIGRSELDEEKKKRYLPLIEYLIAQTVFKPQKPSQEDKNKPFYIFVQVVDQIGGNLFNTQSRKESIFGLVEENVFEKYKKGETFIFNPYRFFNFVNLRLPELVGDEEADMIFKAFEKEKPSMIDLKNEQITITPEDLKGLVSLFNLVGNE